MASLLGSYKTEIGNSLKQVENQKGQKAMVQKNSKKT